MTCESPKTGNGFEVTPRADATPIAGSHLLLAVGRRPNTDDLGLDAAGVETDARGYIVVDDQLRTNVDHIWAMGDCNGKGAFTHTSYNDFEIVAANLLDNDPRRVSDRIPTYALYIDPPLGRAGMTVDEVRASGRRALIGTRPMTRVGRAVEKGETQGFMKVVVDAETKEILGAAILGVGGDEVDPRILDIMSAKAPYTTLSRTMHIHPDRQRADSHHAAGDGTARLATATPSRGDGTGDVRYAPRHWRRPRSARTDGPAPRPARRPCGARVGRPGRG